MRAQDAEPKRDANPRDAECQKTTISSLQAKREGNCQAHRFFLNLGAAPLNYLDGKLNEKYLRKVSLAREFLERGFK